MNKEQVKEKVSSAAYSLVNEKGYIAPVELLIRIDILPRADYENWRMGRIPYLEKACKVNLSKMSLLMKELRSYANKNNFKASFTVYKKWGKGNKINLRFSKYGDINIEKLYATHYVSTEFLCKAKGENEIVGNII
jgi:hypothetical protein